MDGTQVLHSSLKAFRPITVRLLNYRADGTAFVNDLTVMPIVDRATNTTSHFLGILRERPLPEPQRSLPSLPWGNATTTDAVPTGDAAAQAVEAAPAATAAMQQQGAIGQPLDSAPYPGITPEPMRIPTQLQEALQVRIPPLTRLTRPPRPS